MQTLIVCWALIRASVRGAMQYRANFIAEVLFGVVYNSIGFLFILLVLGQFTAIDGWTLGEITLLYGIRLCGHGMWSLCFSSAMMLDYYVQQGEWDRFLVRPMSAIVQMMVSHFRVAVFGDVLAGIVVLTVGISKADVAWTPAHVLFLGATILGSAALDGAFAIGPGALTFRFLNTQELRGTFEYLLSQFSAYPLTILERPARYLLTFVIPLAFVTWIPGAVLLGREDTLPVPAWLAWSSPLVGVAIFALTCWFFRRESRHYQSAGS